MGTGNHFYSAQYVEYWRKIAESLPDWRFYTYTRSWISPALRKAIEENLLPLDNFVVYASTDPDTPRPPRNWLEAPVVERQVFWDWIKSLDKNDRKRFIDWILFRDDGETLFENNRLPVFNNDYGWRWCREEATKMLTYKKNRAKVEKLLGVSREYILRELGRRIGDHDISGNRAPSCDLCMWCPLGRGNVVFILH